jgi:hypothetical protein
MREAMVFSIYFRIFQLFVRLPEIDSAQYHPESLNVNLDRVPFLPRPGKFVFFEPLEPQAESGPVPPDDLQPISRFVTEYEKMAAQGIHFHFFRDDDDQAVYLFAKIGRSRLDEYLYA